MRMIRSMLAPVSLSTIVVCLVATSSAQGSDWPMQGADAGMTKYSPGNVSADSPLELSYRKRFYTDWRTYTGNYYYGSSVVVRNRQAVVGCNDQDSPARTTSSRTVAFTKFNWFTGQALGSYNSRFYREEHAREINSHHFTNPLVWHSDGRIYWRRGGDNTANWVLDPDTGVWTTLLLASPPDGSSWGGDANAFMRIYGDYLIYRYGDTRDNEPYAAYDISPAAWANGTRGKYKMSIGPWVLNKYQYYGDVPKIAQNVVVLACCDYPGLTLVARNLSTGVKWTRSFASDYGGAMGFYTSISDYWRFIASEEGYYVFFTRSGAPTIRVVDIQTGEDKWSYTLTDGAERPLLACHDGVLYVIGRAQQLKLSLADGSVIWQQNNSFPNDAGYVHANYEYGAYMTSDPLYRPMVLTDSTLWFVDGSSRGQGTLVGLRTSDGTIVRQINLASLYSGTESLDYVNDLMTADGRLGLLVSVSDTNDPNHTPVFYQDLYVYAQAAYTLTLVNAGAGSGTVTLDPPGGSYAPGTTVTLTATPDASSLFAGWGGDLRGTTNPATITVSTNTTVTATFPLEGDFDGDDHVNIRDLLMLASAWGTADGDLYYDPTCDINSDGYVDVVDLLKLAANWGR